MSDKNLHYQNVSITTKELTTAWSDITPASDVAKMSIRATGTFKLASSSSPGSEYMTIPSGTQFDYEGSGDLYASMPKAGVAQLCKYS